MTSTSAMWTSTRKASPKPIWKKPSVSRLKPCRRSSSIRNTSAVAPTLRPTLKSIWACLPSSNEETPSP
ncbi:hypothetical protein ID866_3155 [Astraeus odoratus]|nr:hypothetical protein ID866_3155 [Astraeus odoratus]